MQTLRFGYLDALPIGNKVEKESSNTWFYTYVVGCGLPKCLVRLRNGDS